jgi:acetoacetate decarboxylase
MHVVDNDPFALFRHRQPVAPQQGSPGILVGAHHFLADLTLPYGRVVYDYNKQADDLAEAAQ